MFHIYNKATDFTDTWYWGRLYTRVDQISWGSYRSCRKPNFTKLKKKVDAKN